MDAGEGGDQGDEPGSSDKVVGTPWDCQGLGDGSVSVQGDCGQQVIRWGQGKGLEELKNLHNFFKICETFIKVDFKFQMCNFETGNNI